MPTDLPARPHTGPRPHTGRRRNDAVRGAILAATADLLTTSRVADLTVDAIASAAGVGKQTIYRWWPSKGAVLLEAMTERARIEVPTANTGTVLGDLTAFLAATFAAASDPPAAALLRAVMAEAQRDEHTSDVLRAFTDHRRAALREVLARGQWRAELAPTADLDLIIDQAFGVLWYRVLLGHPRLSRRDATELAAGLVRQAQAS